MTSIAGHDVHRIGYGTAQLPRLAHDRDTALALLRRAVELGVNHIDTAQFYGNGFANEIVREAAGSDAVIVTKVGATPDPRTRLRLAQRPEELRADVELNLRGLGLEQLPVVNLRRTDSGPGLRASGDHAVDPDDQLATLTALRDEGKIGAIGLSSVSLDVLHRALPAGIVCVQNAYSLVARDDEPLLALCRAENIAWVPFYPLGGVFPGMPKVTDEPVVHTVADELGVTPSQVGLAWLLHHAPNTLLIPGTADVAHLEANLSAGEIRFDAATLARLDTVPSRTSQILFD